MKINVTQNDITKAKELRRVEGHYTCDCCPIALAVHRHVKLKGAIVTSHSIELLNHLNFCYELPDKASNFIDNFDNDRPVKPFSFQIDV